MSEQKTIDSAHKRVIFAASLGTVFEWYDFYLYGALLTVISAKFFSGMNDTTAFMFALLAFGAGFFVRPFGALVFGRLGDLVGRKYTFLITIVIMGSSTALVGMLPSYETIGVAAPIILICLRLLQGLALGGEYGGAATYVAEHAPDGKRGLYTSWIQTTATMGLFLSLMVILACRTLMSAETFNAWGWRVPFLLSIVLLVVSVYIRLQLAESPVFQEIKNEGKLSKAPLTESFGQLEQSQDRPARAAGCHRWPGGGVVRRTVLRAVLPGEDPAGRLPRRQHHHGSGVVDRHAILHRVRSAVGQDRPQEDRAHGMPAGRAHLLPHFSRADALRQPGAGCRRESLACRRWWRIRTIAVSSSIPSARRPSPSRATWPKPCWRSPVFPTKT